MAYSNENVFNAELIKNIQVESGTPNNGEILVYNSSTQTWQFSSGGGGGAPVDAEYYVASSNGSLTNEIVVTGLGTVNGIMKGNGSGAISSATAGTDYVTPTGSETLSNKTLTSPVINVGSDAEGDIYYRNSGGAFTRLGAGSEGQVLTLSSGLPSWATASGGGLTWGDSFSGTSGSGLTATIDNSSSAGTSAHKVVIGNTQSASTELKGYEVDFGTSNNGDKRGIVFSNLQYGGVGIYADITSGQLGRSPRVLDVRMPSGTASSIESNGVYIQNNSLTHSSSFNTGVRIWNIMTKIGSGTGLDRVKGSAVGVWQSGAGGTSHAVYGGDNVNTSNGLYHTVISNTQSGASTLDYKDLGTSAQSHIANRVIMNNAATGARGTKYETGSSGTGIPIEFSTTGTGRKTMTMSSGFTETSATAGSNGDVPAQVDGYILIDVGGTTKKIPYYNS